LKKASAADGAPVLVHAPIVTMKIKSLKGRPVEELLRNSRGGRDTQGGAQASGSPNAAAIPSDASAEKKAAEGRKGGGGERMPGWTLRREYRSTFRGQLEGTERLVSGTFVGRVEPGEPVVPVSMEEGLVKDMGLALGDEIEWDVQGVPIRTKLGSVRAVEWRRLEPNFFVVFPEGVLEPAPKFHVAAVRAEDSDHSARVQRALVAAFPNVTAIDLALVMQTVDGIFSKVAFVVNFMAAFTVLTGVIVLAGAVLTGRFQRIRETVLLRTLGATRSQLLKIQLVEYAILGLLAAFVGCVLAVMGNALLAHFVFRITPSVPVVLLLGGALAVCVVTVITGMLTGRGVANHPPLEILRQET
jgi:putative ABC transport system permease protein